MVKRVKLSDLKKRSKIIEREKFLRGQPIPTFKNGQRVRSLFVPRWVGIVKEAGPEVSGVLLDDSANLKHIMYIPNHYLTEVGEAPKLKRERT